MKNKTTLTVVGPLLSPKGHEITGTFEVLNGVAQINQASVKNGKIEFEYDGYTDMLWDSQKSVIEKGQRLFVDSEGNIYPENKIISFNKSLNNKRNKK